MPCIYDTRWIGPHGIGRFAAEVASRLPHAQLRATGRPMSALDPMRLSLINFPERAWLLSPGYNAPLRSPIPYILTIHDLNHVDRADNSSALKRIYYRTVLTRLCKNARAVLTVSDYSRSRVIDWFGIDADRVFNVGNGVSDGFSPNGPRHVHPRPYFLCVSNRRGHKNEHGLLSAFAQSNLPERADLMLTGEPERAIVDHARALGIADRVTFMGRVSENELAALYRGALCLVFPSFYEGFGLPIVEAFASGTPVVTSNVSSMPEIAGDAALLVDPHRPQEIARAMERIHSSVELREDLSSRGLARARIFTWDAVAERVRISIKSVDLDPKYPLDFS